MTVQRSTSSRNAMLDALETAYGVSVRLQLRSGAQPATCATADSGVLLAEFLLPADWAAAASGGAKAFNAVSAVTAVASGTIGHYRIKDNAGTTCHEKGSVGLVGASPDVVVDNPAVLAGQQVSVTGWTLTAPGA